MDNGPLKEKPIKHWITRGYHGLALSSTLHNVQHLREVLNDARLGEKKNVNVPGAWEPGSRWSAGLLPVWNGGWVYSIQPFLRQIIWKLLIQIWQWIIWPLWSDFQTIPQVKINLPVVDEREIKDIVHWANPHKATTQLATIPSGAYLKWRWIWCPQHASL